MKPSNDWPSTITSLFSRTTNQLLFSFSLEQYLLSCHSESLHVDWKARFDWLKWTLPTLLHCSRKYYKDGLLLLGLNLVRLMRFQKRATSDPIKSQIVGGAGFGPKWDTAICSVCYEQPILISRRVEQVAIKLRNIWFSGRSGPLGPPHKKREHDTVFHKLHFITSVLNVCSTNVLIEGAVDIMSKTISVVLAC